MHKSVRPAHSSPPTGAAGRQAEIANAGSDPFEWLVVQDARVFKAGNSLAIRIPSAIAKHCDLDDGAAVELGTDRGVIYIRKAPSRDLLALIERITPENMHALEFDEPVGAERW